MAKTCVFEWVLILVLLQAMGFHTTGGEDQDTGNPNILDALKSKGWEPMQVDRWQEWVIPMYGEAVRVTSRLNRNALDSCSDWDEADAANDGGFDFPVFVMNLPSRRDRQQHTRCLLRSLGFRNVSFPTSTLATELDVIEATASGLITPTLIQDLQNTQDFGEKAALAYAANALDMLRCMGEAIAAEVPLFGVFEDDLVRASSHAATRQRIRDAIADLPPTADMLYLEACFDICDRSLHSPAHKHLFAPHKPMCSAAILYTLKGAQRVREECVPVFDGIDIMLPKLIQEGRLEAYVAKPQPFFQDGFWGTDANRKRTFDGHSVKDGVPQHRIWLPTCMESEPFMYDELGVGSAQSLARSFWVEREQSGWHLPHAAAIIYYTQVEVAVWRGEEEGVALEVPPWSVCWSSHSSLCPLELVLEGEDGAELGVKRRFLFLDFGLPHDPSLDPAVPWQPSTQRGTAGLEGGDASVKTEL